jgi:hypothetical protein
VAGAVWLIMTAGWGSSDGSGAAALVFLPVFGAVVGFALGLVIPWLWAWWKTGLAPAVGSMLGTFAGAVVGALWPILTRAPESSYRWRDIAPSVVGLGFYGAVVGFALGLVIPLLWAWWKADRASAVGAALGAFAGAVAGMVVWMVMAALGLSGGWETAGPISVFAVFGAVAGVLPGLALSLIWRQWKGRPAARPGAKNSVKLAP